MPAGRGRLRRPDSSGFASSRPSTVRINPFDLIRAVTSWGAEKDAPPSLVSSAERKAKPAYAACSQSVAFESYLTPPSPAKNVPSFSVKTPVGTTRSARLHHVGRQGIGGKDELLSLKEPATASAAHVVEGVLLIEEEAFHVRVCDKLMGRDGGAEDGDGADRVCRPCYGHDESFLIRPRGSAEVEEADQALIGCGYPGAEDDGDIGRLADKRGCALELVRL